MIPTENRGRKPKYGLHAMEVGEEKLLTDTNYAAVTRLRRYWEGKTGRKFTVRKSQDADNTYHLWRVA